MWARSSSSAKPLDLMATTSSPISNSGRSTGTSRTGLSLSFAARAVRSSSLICCVHWGIPAMAHSHRRALPGSSNTVYRRCRDTPRYCAASRIDQPLVRRRSARNPPFFVLCRVGWVEEGGAVMGPAASGVLPPGRCGSGVCPRRGRSRGSTGRMCAGASRSLGPRTGPAPRCSG